MILKYTFMLVFSFDVLDDNKLAKNKQTYFICMSHILIYILYSALPNCTQDYKYPNIFLKR